MTMSTLALALDGQPTPPPPMVDDTEHSVVVVEAGPALVVEVVAVADVDVEPVPPVVLVVDDVVDVVDELVVLVGDAVVVVCGLVVLVVATVTSVKVVDVVAGAAVVEVVAGLGAAVGAGDAEARPVGAAVVGAVGGAGVVGVVGSSESSAGSVVSAGLLAAAVDPSAASRRVFSTYQASSGVTFCTGPKLPSSSTRTRKPACTKVRSPPLPSTTTAPVPTLTSQILGTRHSTPKVVPRTAATAFEVLTSNRLPEPVTFWTRCQVRPTCRLPRISRPPAAVRVSRSRV